MQDVTNAEKTSTAEAPDEERLIRAALEELRPTLKRDGGDIQLYKVEGDLVVVEMSGACVGCVLASVTVAGVRKIISEKVGRPMKVIPRSAFIPVNRMRARGASRARRSIQITEGSKKVGVPA